MATVDAEAPIADDTPEVKAESSPKPDRSWRWLFWAAATMSGLLLGASILVMLAQEQFAVETVVGCIVGLSGLLYATGWWRLKTVSAALIVDVLLIFVYTWTLGESVHVVVYGDSKLYFAIVDGDRAASGAITGNVVQPQYSRSLRVNTSNGKVDQIGLYQGYGGQYNVTSFGTASHTPFAGSFWGDLLDDFRFLTPQPAFSNIHLEAGPNRNVAGSFQPRPGRGTCGANPRGELACSRGATEILGNLPSRDFKLSFDLNRPDGTQGVLLGIGPAHSGYLLAIRYDHRDAKYFYWDHGKVGECTCHRAGSFALHTLPMIQRALRMFLPSVILAMSLALLAIPLYLILWPLVTFAGRGLKRLGVKAPKQRRWFGWIPDGVAAGAAIAVIISGAVLMYNVEHFMPTIEDTVTYIFQGKTLALGHFSVPPPPNLRFFGRPFVIAEHHHWFGKYPPGWPLLLAAGQVLGKMWMTPATVAGLGVIMMYLLGRELYGRTVAVLAALLAATSPFVISMGGSYLAHGATWLWLGTFTYLLVLAYKRIAEGRRFTWRISRSGIFLLAGAGFALGMAFITRQFDALLFCVPFLFLLLRKPVGFLWLAVGAAIPSAFFVLYNEVVTGTVLSDAYIKAQSFDQPGFGCGLGGTDPYSSCFTFSRGVWNITYNLTHLEPTLLGWPFFITLAFASVTFVIGRANVWDWLLVGCCALVAFGYTFYWASGVSGGYARYWYIFAPLLILLIGRGFVELCLFPARMFKLAPSPLAGAIAPAIVVMALAGFNIREFIPGIIYAWDNPAVRPLRQAEAAHIHHAVIFQVQPVLPTSQIYANVFTYNSPALNTDVIWAIDHGLNDIRLMRRYPHRSYWRLYIDPVTKVSHLTRMYQPLPLPPDSQP